VTKAAAPTSGVLVDCVLVAPRFVISLRPTRRGRRVPNKAGTTAKQAQQDSIDVGLAVLIYSFFFFVCLPFWWVACCSLKGWRFGPALWRGQNATGHRTLALTRRYAVATLNFASPLGGYTNPTRSLTQTMVWMRSLARVADGSESHPYRNNGLAARRLPQRKSISSTSNTRVAREGIVGGRPVIP
jgi:hypothetical protein